MYYSSKSDLINVKSIITSHLSQTVYLDNLLHESGAKTTQRLNKAVRHK